MESQEEMISRIKAEAVEARQHPCPHCKHGPGTHAFDVYEIDQNSAEPCWRSCTECFNNQTKRLNGN